MPVLPHFRESFIANSGNRLERWDHHERHIYPRAYAPGGPEFLGPQLEFALKYDGINLGLLNAIFQQAEPQAVARYVRSKPIGKYTRRAWFLYEWLTGRELDVPDLDKGNYINLLEPDEYLIAAPKPSRRHRVNENLLGNLGFCPLVRRTPILKEFIAKDLAGRARAIIDRYDPLVLARASQYLYMKETRSSYEIEREQPNQRRTLRFIKLLRRAHQIKHLDKATLIEVERAILDPRFAPDDYRDNQNYVGETAGFGRQLIHYVSPRPQDVQGLMDGLLVCMERMAAAQLDPVIQAAVAAFGFVFIHPFEDGNGRTHRFMIHQILSRDGFTPEGTIFPVSAVMKAEEAAYDRILETFSRPVLELVDYALDEAGGMSVANETLDLYRFVDFTGIAEYLYGVVERTIDHEFVGEFEFLIHYDQARRRMQEIVDLPDRKMDLFLRLVRQNHGRLSKRKRESEFAMLTNEEVERLEAVVVDELRD